MTPRTPGSRTRASGSRMARVANYKIVLEAMDCNPMDLHGMAALIKVGETTFRNYFRSMLWFGAIQKTIKPGFYTATTDAEKVKRFLTFVENCLSVEEELGSKRQSANDTRTVAKRTVIVSKAAQIGMWRDGLVTALFGRPSETKTA